MKLRFVPSVLLNGGCSEGAVASRTPLSGRRGSSSRSFFSALPSRPPGSCRRKSASSKRRAPSGRWPGQTLTRGVPSEKGAACSATHLPQTLQPFGLRRFHSPSAPSNPPQPAGRSSFVENAESLCVGDESQNSLLPPRDKRRRLLACQLSGDEVQKLVGQWAVVRSQGDFLRRTVCDQWGLPGGAQSASREASRRFLRWVVETVFEFQRELALQTGPEDLFFQQVSLPEKIKRRLVADLLFALRDAAFAEKALVGVGRRREVGSLKRLLSLLRDSTPKSREDSEGFSREEFSSPQDGVEIFVEDSYAAVFEFPKALPVAAAPLLALFRLALAADLPQLLASKNLLRLADLTDPLRWFPPRPPRRVYVHVGPPNSGKTWRALERFVKSSSGVYLAPLRLLAREVFASVKNRGVKCALVRELHLCGEARVQSLARILAAYCKDSVEEVNVLAPFKPVKVEEELWKSWEDARPGDCVMAFSREQVLRQRQLAEESGLRVAVVYGRLPQRVRAEQARLFNSAVEKHAKEQKFLKEKETLQAKDSTDGNAATPPPPFSVMVATDAVGLGLNLNVRRVVFLSTTKPSPDAEGGRRPLTLAELRQIASRAGRRGGVWEEEGGFVSAVCEEDKGLIAAALADEASAESLQTEAKEAAALLPEPWCFELVLDQLDASVSTPQPPLSRAEALMQFSALLRTEPPFFVAKRALEAAASVCALLQDVPLSGAELATLCQAPLPMKTQSGSAVSFRLSSENAGPSDAPPEDAAAKDEVGFARVSADGLPLHLQAALRWIAVSLAANKSAPLPPLLRFGGENARDSAKTTRSRTTPPLRGLTQPAAPEAAAAGVGQWGVCADTPEGGGVRKPPGDSLGLFQDSDLGPLEALDSEFDLEEGQDPFSEECSVDLKEVAPRCSEKDLRAWEAAHQILEFYIWLSLRHPTRFPDGAAAVRAKEELETAIDAALRRASLELASPTSFEQDEETQTAQRE